MTEEKLVNFFLDSEIYRELKILSAREGRSIKDILTEEIREYCKVHKEGNPQHMIDGFLENDDFTGFPSVAIDYDKKKSYLEKNLQKDGRLNELGKELWGHILQWYKELEKH